MSAGHESTTKTTFADVSKRIFGLERRQFHNDPHKGITVTNRARENELSASILTDYINKSAIANGWGAVFDETLHAMTPADVAIYEARRDKVVVLVPGGSAQVRKEREDKFEEELDKKEKARKALVLNQNNIIQKNKLAGLALQNIVMKCIVRNGYSHVMDEWEGDLQGIRIGFGSDRIRSDQIPIVGRN